MSVPAAGRIKKFIPLPMVFSPSKLLLSVRNNYGSVRAIEKLKFKIGGSSVVYCAYDVWESQEYISEYGTSYVILL